MHVEALDKAVNVANDLLAFVAFGTLALCGVGDAGGEALGQVLGELGFGVGVEFHDLDERKHVWLFLGLVGGQECEA